MKIKYKIAIAIFTFGIAILMVTILIFTHTSKRHMLEQAKETSSEQLSLTIEHIESTISEQISITMTLANSWVLRDELLKSNKSLQVLGDGARTELIESLNALHLMDNAVRNIL